MGKLSVLKAKSNPFLCAVSSIPFSYPKASVWQFSFLSLHHHIPALLLEYFHQHKTCSYFFILQQQPDNILMTSLLLPAASLFLSFPLQQNSFWKLSALAVFNVSSPFLPWTHSNQALASTPALKLLFSWSSAQLKSGCHLLVLFLCACSVAFDTIVYSLSFPCFQHTTRTWYSYSTSGYCLSISFASSFSSHQCLKFEVSYGLILGLLLSLCTTFWWCHLVSGLQILMYILITPKLYL